MKKKLLSLNLPAVRTQILKLSTVSLVFAFVKINAFTAALFLTNFVGDIADFGVFEYALSIGLIAAIPLNFGLQGAYPFFNLKLKKEGYKSVFYFHSLSISLVLLGVFLIDFLGGNFLSPGISLALLVAGIYANQISFSSIFKSHDRVITAAFLDGGMFLILNTYNLFLFLTGNVYQLVYLKIFFLSYFTLLAGFNVYLFFKNRRDFSIDRYFDTLKYGKNIVVSTFLIICLTGSARIFIEHFLGSEAVGFYGFYFRLAAVTVLVHQVINIAFFKKMYEAEPRILDKYFALFLASLATVGLLMQQLIPMIFGNMFGLFAESTAEHQLLYLVLTFQMIFWIALALNENIINRENLAPKINSRYLFLLGGMVLAIYLLGEFDLLNLPSLTFVNMTVLFLGLEMQIRLLKSKGIFFTKMRNVGRGVMILAVICFALF